MKAVLFSFTTVGTLLSERIASFLRHAGWDVTAKGYADHIPRHSTVTPLEQPLSQAVGVAFQAAQCLIFIGAAGIAVRMIAPYIQQKTTDPAVLVLDERGQFVIPLLSGHIGGANALARQLAAQLRGQAVLTTATDVNDLFAVDEWAARQGLVLPSLAAAKAFAAAILETKSAGLYSDFPVTGTLPPSLHKAAVGTVGIAAALRSDCHPFRTTVVVQPVIFHLGIGCRSGKSAAEIAAAVDAILQQLAIHPQAVAAVHSIDLKAREPGLVAFCAQRHWPFTTYSAKTLAAVPGHFTASSLVLRVVGVDNVCERAAVAGSHGGTLVLPKQAGNGITIAVAYEPYTLSFT